MRSSFISITALMFIVAIIIIALTTTATFTLAQKQQHNHEQPSDSDGTGSGSSSGSTTSSNNNNNNNDVCSSRSHKGSCHSDPGCVWCSVSDWSDNGCCIQNTAYTRTGDYCSCPWGQSGSVGNQLQFFFTLFLFIIFLRAYIAYKRQQELQMLEIQQQQDGDGRLGAGVGPRVVVRTVVVNEDGTEQTLDQAERHEHDTSMFNHFFAVLNQRRLELMMQMQMQQQPQQQAELGVVVEEMTQNDNNSIVNNTNNNNNSISSSVVNNTETTSSPESTTMISSLDQIRESLEGRTRISSNSNNNNSTNSQQNDNNNDEDVAFVEDERKPIIPRPPLGYSG